MFWVLAPLHHTVPPPIVVKPNPSGQCTLYRHWEDDCKGWGIVYTVLVLYTQFLGVCTNDWTNYLGLVWLGLVGFGLSHSSLDMIVQHCTKFLGLRKSWKWLCSDWCMWPLTNKHAVKWHTVKSRTLESDLYFIQGPIKNIVHEHNFKKCRVIFKFHLIFCVVFTIMSGFGPLPPAESIRK